MGILACRRALRSLIQLALAPLLFLLLWALVGTTTGIAAEKLPSGPQHRGLISIGPYQIFPENRLDNGVYLDKQLLLTLNGQTIQDLIPLRAEGRFVYLARDPLGQPRLGAHLAQGEPTPRIVQAAENYFHAVMVADGVVFKKFYRITSTGIEDLLPQYKTADGITSGQIGIIFYHVASAGTNADEEARYGIRLHFVPLGGGPVRQLGYLIQSPAPSLKLRWISESEFEYSHGEGLSDIITIEQFE